MFLQAASLIVLLSHATQILATRSLSMTLSGPAQVTDVDNFSVVAEITNTGDEALRLYRDPHSALSDFPENTFTFSCPDDDDDATPPPFIGAKVKYSLGAATEFVTLAPGESSSVTHHLSAAYNFTAPGSYEIDASGKFYAYEPDTNGPVAIHATVPGTHRAKLQGSLVSTIVAKREEGLSKRAVNGVHGVTLSKRAQFAGCNATQQGDVAVALNGTQAYIAGAIEYLTVLSNGTERYITWFGTYNETRKDTVLNHYTKIQTSDPTTYKYDCSTCIMDAYAYVYADRPGVVFLCSVFWTANFTGTDSKAGTIVHESSHFTINGGTQDYAYGHTLATQLAIDYPDEAIMNADSHEYFAENTPALD